MSAHEPQLEEIEARRTSAPAVFFATLSKGASLIFIVSVIGFLPLLWINWRMSLILFLVGVLSAVLARYWNRRKLCVIYGSQFGRLLDDNEWNTGKKVQF